MKANRQYNKCINKIFGCFPVHHQTQSKLKPDPSSSPNATLGLLSYLTSFIMLAETAISKKKKSKGQMKEHTTKVKVKGNKKVGHVDA